MKVATGDWIRFMHGGRLVIDEVAYLVRRASWDSTLDAMTVSSGAIDMDSILEVRHKLTLKKTEAQP